MSATVWAYPWDLVDEGIARAADCAAGLGLDGIRVAAAYHGQPIQPVLSHLLDGADPLEEVTRECHRRGMTATAWMVPAPNTRLAQRYPEYQVCNAFGNGYAYCLCPAQPATRDYILALIGELVASYDVDAVELESPGYLGFLHGYHHEFHGVAPGLVEQSLLALCFCPACQRLLREEGIDPEPLQARERDAVDRGFDQGPADPSRVIEMVTALIADIAALVHARGKKLFCSAPVFVEPASLDWVEGTEARRLAPLVDCWELALYSPDQPERVARAQRAASLGLPCALGAGINAGSACTRDAEDLGSAALAAKGAGIEHIGFYNCGVLPQARLQWLSQAAEAFRS